MQNVNIITRRPHLWLSFGTNDPIIKVKVHVIDEKNIDLGLVRKRTAYSRYTQIFVSWTCFSVLL